ncbi:MAG: phosphate signaling complex protein PhoU [Aestuariivirgaceae bacterium]
MDNAHIVKSFDEDLNHIESLLLEMGGLVETQINDAVRALTRRDCELGEKVRKDDKRIDELETRIDELSIQTLALRQPMAEDLRSVVCALKVSTNLERIGDYAKNIAKRTSVLAQAQPTVSSSNTIRRMSKLVQEMVHDVLDAYVARDMEMAADLRLRDEEVDQMHNTLFRELLTYMMEDPRNITPCMHLLFVAKNIERMGDHTTGIAEQVYYRVSGSMPDDDRPKGDMTSYMSVDPEGEQPTKD